LGVKATHHAAFPPLRVAFKLDASRPTSPALPRRALEQSPWLICGALLTAIPAEAL